MLETLGIPVLGYRTDTLPLFYDGCGWAAGLGAGRQRRRRRHGSPTPTGGSAATRSWSGGRRPRASTSPTLIEEGVAEARRQGIDGQGVTPFVLAFLHERSGGETLRVNRELIVENAALAGEIAVSFAALG